MSADQDISQNSRKAKHNGPDAHLSHRKRRETGIISYHHAVLRNLTAYFALGGVIVGLRPYSQCPIARQPLAAGIPLVDNGNLVVYRE